MILIYAIVAAGAIFLASAIFYFETTDLGEVLVLVLCLPLLGVLGAFGYGAYGWLRHGEWAAVSLTEALVEVGVAPEQIYRQSGWVGVDQVAQWFAETNVGWAFLMLFAVLAYSAAHWSEKGSEARHVKKLLAASIKREE